MGGFTLTGPTKVFYRRDLSKCRPTILNITEHTEKILENRLSRDLLPLPEELLDKIFVASGWQYTYSIHTHDGTVIDQ